MKYLKKTIKSIRFLAFCLLSSLSLMASANVSSDKLKIGITLHPYYSYVANVVADKAELVPLIDSGFNPHNYSLNPADIARLRSLDALVVNGIGHDDFALKAVERLKLPNLTIIEANRAVPLLRQDGRADGKPNSHTFVAVDAAIRQVYSIAKALGKLDPVNAKFFQRNALGYAKKLRALKLPVQQALLETNLADVRIASTHNAYGYLLQEFGLTVSAVVEPAHGISPTASQLQGTIDEIRKVDIDVLFTELNMENSYVEVIERETGIKVFHFSHMTHGEYDEQMVVKEMAHNLSKLQEALSYAVKKNAESIVKHDVTSHHSHSDGSSHHSHTSADSNGQAMEHSE